MALNDLLDSMQKVAKTLERIDASYSAHFLNLKKKIEDARSSGRDDIVKYILITDVYDDFRVGMGDWLYDAPLDLPPGISREEARRMMGEAMDDMFFNFLFWDTDLKTARKKYKEAIDKSESDDLPRVLFSCSPEWFEDWSDLGKLLTDPEIAGAYRTRDYLKPSLQFRKASREG